MAEAALADDLVFQYLATSAGSIEMGVNGAVTAVEFAFLMGRPMVLQRINFSHTDNAAQDVDGFFSIAALTNGVTIQAQKSDGTVRQHFGTDVAPIKRSTDFGALAGIDVDSDSVGAVSSFNVRWTVARAGRGVLLPAGERLVLTVQDDLSELAQLRGMVQGYVVRPQDEVG